MQESYRKQGIKSYGYLELVSGRGKSSGKSPRCEDADLLEGQQGIQCGCSSEPQRTVE